MHEEILKHLIELDTRDLKSSESDSDSKELYFIQKCIYCFPWDIA